MAKVVSPLFGFSASGKLGDTLVYMTWKGINDVRRYVIPANPNTADQQTQRGYLTAAVTEWHNAGYDTADKTAWILYAAQLAQVMSGFNAMVKAFIDTRLDAKAWQRLFDGVLEAGSVSGFKASVDSDNEDDEVTCHWGYSPTFMPTEQALAFATGVWSADNIAGSSGSRVYAYFTQDPASEHGRTGIYTYKIA